MANTQPRTDILRHDVFISWTGKDRQLKDRIVSYLRDNGITVLESDHDCAGDFRQWSQEAVSRCTVFLLLYTDNTVYSTFVPLEIEALKELDDWRNRCLPAVSAFDLYAKNLPDLAESQSAVLLGDDDLDEILHKVQMLIRNRMFHTYREATRPAYLKLRSFLRMVHARDREFDFESLYINRAVLDEAQDPISDAAAFTVPGEIFFLQGPAGIGKSSYIDQLRTAAGDRILLIALPCQNLTDTKDLSQALFEAFQQQCGNRAFFTIEGFLSMLSVTPLLLVLDGMDEIATKTGRQQLLDVVSSYYRSNASSTTLFFTGRNMEDADSIAISGQTPKRLTLCPFDEVQIETFCKSLFLLLEKPEKCQVFYERTKTLTNEIRTNPLLLSQLAIVYDQKSQVPQTAVGIYDAVCEITFSRDDRVAHLPERYRDMVTLELPGILKAFSVESYRLRSFGKRPAAAKILATVLKQTYPDARERAAFLEEYLRDRGMMDNGEFYHKMLMEYFTAVYYYEHCFDDYDELENEEELKALFSHYGDPYWSSVLQLFLLKADSLMDEAAASGLYTCLATCGITEYTLLFDTCRDLVNHREIAQCILLFDILQKSATGIYPPYGPLCWYVPEYELYPQVLLTLDGMKAEPYFPKALALVRDVCWIFGRYNTVSEITDRVSGKALFSQVKLPGGRRGLCELFYTGGTTTKNGADVYPRCFNLVEAKHWKTQGCGILGRMTNAFRDDLGLYSHTMFSELGGEYIGIVAAPYDRANLESLLPQKSCKKLCGLFLSPTKDSNFTSLAINDRHLKAVYAPENTERFDVGDFLHSFTILSDALLYFKSTVHIPKGVRKIDFDAFLGCTSLKRITIPDSVTAIRDLAFAGCTSLTEINIPTSVTEIGNGAFSGCTSLTSLKIPNSVTEIGSAAFEDCQALTRINIPKGVTEIDYNTFSKCASLTELTIPNSVTLIGSSAFEDCAALTKVSLPNGVRKIGMSAFSGCIALTEIAIPNSVTEIGEYAFSNCESLTRINIPNGVNYINAHTFYYCKSLSSITLPDRLTAIEAYAFGGCTAITTIRIPKGVTNLGRSAFSGCSALAKIEFSRSVREIGPYAFLGCTALTEITIPDSVLFIGEGAFSGCLALRCIENCPAGYDRNMLGAPENCIILTRQSSGSGALEIARGTKRIRYEEYHGRCDIHTVYLPDTVTAIEARAFCGCAMLTQIKIPNGVTEIEEGSFSGCELLTGLTIPDSVTRIGASAFSDCTSLTKITLPSSIRIIADHLFSNCTSLTQIGIPNSAVEIGANAFSECISLSNITIPNTVREIGWNAFRNCTSLSEIAIPDSVAEIRSGVFFNCSSLTAITLPDSVRRIEPETFSGCKALAEIIIPNTVTRIRPKAFSGCCSLTEIALPNSLQSIGWNAFSNCTSLRRVTIPNRVTEIDGKVFFNCRSLTDITIPDSVEEIISGAFSGCISLSAITIPASVRFIGDSAFEGCIGLQEISISRRFEDDLSRIFAGVDLSKVTIHWL